MDIFDALLTAQNPYAFSHRLAVSLAILAKCLDAVGKQQDGLAANTSALVAIRTPFERYPAVFARSAHGMLHEYLGRCEKLGREPDSTLLIPLLEGLQNLQGKWELGGYLGP